MDSLPAFISYLGADRCYKFVNKHYEERFGLPKDEIVGRSVQDVLGESNYRAIRPHIDSALAGRQISFETTLLFGAIGERTLSAEYVPDILADGSVRGLYALAIDITERKQTGAALQESEKKFRMLADNIPGVVYLCRNDDRYSMLYLNDAVEALTGHPKKDFLEDRISFVDLYHPDDAGKIVSTVDAALAGRRPFELVYRMRHRNGRWRWIHEVGVGVFDGDGELGFLEGYLSDITKRKRAEALRDGQNRVLELLATDKDLDEVLNTLVQLVESNAPGMLGSVLILAGDRLCHGAAPRLPESYNQAIDGIQIGPSRGSCGTAAYENRRVIVEDVQSDPLWADFRDIATQHKLRACWSQPIISNTGAVLGTFALYYPTPRRPTEAELNLIDSAAHLAGIAIERKQSEEKARQHQEQLAHVSRVSTMGELATGIAHEINQPLAAIASYAFTGESLLEDVSAPYAKQLREIFQALSEQALQAGEIVRRLRNYVKKAPGIKERADLNQLIGEVIKLMRPDIGQSDVQLVLNLDKSIRDVMVDTIQIQQVMVNLIKNAIETMAETPPDQRRLNISTKTHSPDAIAIAVSDSGKGFVDQDPETLFDAFFTTKEEGIGIGLAISRTIVEAHGGHLTAEQNADGGATFRFYLQPT